MGYYDTGRTVADDAELLSRFENGTLEPAEFPHAAHVRVAWLLARRDGRGQAYRTLVAGIRRIAERAGRPGAFHETITRAWFELIAPLDDLSAHPELLDTGLLSRYYSSDALAAGRERWIEPDLQPLVLPAASGLVDVMRNVPSAVAVLAVRSGNRVHGATVGSAVSLSLEPPLVLACLAEGSRTLGLVRAAGSFALSFLAEGQAETADRFGRRARPAGAAQFAGVPHRLTRFGPVLDDAAGWVGCSLDATHAGGDHRIVVGRVGEAGVGERHPLLRHSGAYR